MTALSRFLDRHGLDSNFAAKAGVAASVAMVAAVTFFSPLQAHAQSFDAKHDTTIGRDGMSNRMETLAIRTNDRMRDMVQMSLAIHRLADEGRLGYGQASADAIIEINNQLFQNTPFPELAGMDFQKMTLPDNLEEGAAMEYAVEAINHQKDVLTQSTRSLETLVKAVEYGDGNTAQQALYELDNSLAEYQRIEPQILNNIQAGIRDMKRTNGWQQGIASYED